jgi:RNA-directed DNA polymerase
VEQAPDKTFIGRISKVFVFLGYQFGKKKLNVLKRFIHNHFRRLTQLYEQKTYQPNWKMLLDDYRRR